MPVGRWVGEAVLLGAACAVTAWAAMFTADPPAASVLWPPVGIALAVLYARGRRLWPGLAVAVTVVLFLEMPRYVDRPLNERLAGAALLGVVYAVQAAAGVWALRRLIGRAAPLVRPREIGWFLLVAGPGHAVVGATLGSALVWSFGGWGTDELPARWLSWWRSDALGGILFAPLVLAVVGRPRAVWGPRARTVAVPLALAVGLTAAAYAAARDAEQTAVRSKFELEVEAELRNRAAGVHETEVVLAVLAPTPQQMFWDAPVRNPRPALVERVEQLRAGQLKVGAFAVAAVPAGLREPFEKLAPLTDRDGPAPARAVHYPVVVPDGAHKTGLDLAGDAAWAELIAEAVRTGRPAAAEPDFAATPPVVRVVAPCRGPVWSSAGLPVGPGDRPIGGFIAVEIDPSELLDAVRVRLGLGVTVTLSPPRSGVVGVPSDGFAVRTALRVADQMVPVTVVASAPALARRRPPLANAAGLVGAVITTMFAGLLLGTTGAGALVAEEVAARTAELNAEVEARRAAEAFLRESEARLLDAQRQARLGYWEWHPDRDDMYWSPVLAEMMGFIGSDRRLTLDDLLVRVHADDRAGVRSALDTARAARRAVQFEFRTHGDRPRWLSATVATSPGSAPGPVRGTVLDLTDRKRGELAVREGKARLTIALRAARMGTWEWQVGSDRIHWDERMEAMSGFPPGGFDGRLATVMTLVHPDDRDGLDAVTRGAVGSGEAFEHEFRVVVPGAAGPEVRWQVGFGQLLPAQDGRPARVIGINSDVTERKRTELAIREGQARLGIALTSAGMGTWEWEVGTELLHWDERQLALYGLPPGGFDGRLETFYALIHPDDRGWLGAEVARTVADGSAFEAEFRVVHAGTGEVRWLAGYGQVLPSADGGPARMVGINSDITERKRAELAVREAETRRRLALDAGRMGTLVWDPAADAVAADGTACDLFGVEPGRLASTMTGLLGRVLPEDRDRVIEVHSAAVAAGPGTDCQCEFRVGGPEPYEPGGGVRWLAASGRYVRDGSGGRLYAVLSDVTARKEAEHALRVSEANLSMAQAIARVGSFDWDLTTGLTYWSDEMYRLLGYAPRSVQPAVAALLARVHPDDRSLVTERMDATLNRGEPYRYEFRVLRSSGVRVLSVDAVVVRDAAGKVVSFRGTNQDVTDSRLAEAAVRESEARLAEAQRLARLGSWEAELKTGECRPSVMAYELYGLPPGSTVTVDDILAMIPCEDRGRVDRALAALRSEGGLAEVEHRILRPDGEVRHLNVRGVVPPGTTRMLGTTQDVTDRKREEEERREFHDHLREAQKLESLGILAGGVAHDFNNLLTGILGNASLAREIIPANSELHEFLRPIEKSAEHAAQLCQQMLTYAGKGGTVRGPVDLNTVVEESADLLRLAVSKKAVLTLELAPDLPTLVGDAGQLRQVILNLVQNASESLPERGGPVAVRTGYSASPPDLGPDVTVSGDVPAGEHVWLEVEDGGSGMDPATRSRIFEPFFTTKFTGRGLGLSAVHGIARGHGGALSVASKPGVGTTFRVLIPCSVEGAAWGSVTESSVSDLTPHPTPWTAADRMVALVVDDEPMVRGLAAVALRGLGFRVEEAGTGRAAVELFSANPSQYRLALVDLTMPDGDGRSVLSAVRAARPDLPVVFMSGYDAADVAEIDFGPGLLYLQKPFRAADLTGCVRRAVGTTTVS